MRKEKDLEEVNKKMFLIETYKHKVEVKNMETDMLL